MNNIEKAYKHLQTKNTTSFDNLWTNVKASSYDSKEAELEEKNNFYTNLLMDHRFVMVKNNTWSLRELFSLQEIEEIMNSNYFVDDVAETIEDEADLIQDDLGDDIDSSFDDATE